MYSDCVKNDTYGRGEFLSADHGRRMYSPTLDGLDQVARAGSTPARSSFKSRFALPDELAGSVHSFTLVSVAAAALSPRLPSDTPNTIAPSLHATSPRRQYPRRAIHGVRDYVPRRQKCCERAVLRNWHRSLSH